MIKCLLFFCFLLPVLFGCDGAQVKYGEIRDSGSVLYPLCERAKQRITDMQRISFELPGLFKQAVCINYPDYSYTANTDSLYVVIPGVISNESKMSVGAVYTMSFQTGHARTEFYLPPDKFFEDHKEYLSEHSAISRLVTASWVDWQGGRCARFYSDQDTGLFLRRVVEYFCWESVSGSYFPIYISATERLALGHTPTNLDKEFIEPVLASLQINIVPESRLALWDGYRDGFCKELKDSYDNKSHMANFRNDLNRQRAILFLRECGYQMPDAVGPKNWAQVLRPNGKLIGRADGDETLRKVTHAEFAALEATLMSLQLAPGVRPDIRSYRLSADGNIPVASYSATGPYEGDWYRVPPSYNAHTGVGFRTDPELGRVIDIRLLDYPAGLKIVAE